jgi:hypothetical protein
MVYGKNYKIPIDSKHCKSSEHRENFPNMLDNNIVTLSETFSYFMVYGSFFEKEIAHGLCLTMIKEVESDMMSLETNPTNRKAHPSTRATIQWLE